nr:hypothetical protein [Tanacetum cinerariifolium]
MLELATKEKDEVQLTVQKFENSSKNLSKLLDSQILDKCKTRLGYNDVPPPYTGNFMSPKPDLVYPSLDNFVDVNETVSEFEIEKPTVESNKPKTGRNENRAPIIKDWVSESEEEEESKKEDGIFISQDKYVNEILNKFGFSDVKTASTPMETHKTLLKDEKGEDVDEHLASLDKKSTTRGCQFLGCRLILWEYKKQNVVVNFTTEAEYVTMIHIDNESTNCIVKNLVFHSKTKLIQMVKIHTDKNVADLLTKAFDVSRFQYLIASIEMLNL